MAAQRWPPLSPRWPLRPLGSQLLTLGMALLVGILVVSVIAATGWISLRSGAEIEAGQQSRSAVALVRARALSYRSWIHNLVPQPGLASYVARAKPPQLVSLAHRLDLQLGSGAILLEVGGNTYWSGPGGWQLADSPILAAVRGGGQPGGLVRRGDTIWYEVASALPVPDRGTDRVAIGFQLDRAYLGRLELTLGSRLALDLSGSGGSHGTARQGSRAAGLADTEVYGRTLIGRSTDARAIWMVAVHSVPTLASVAGSLTLPGLVLTLGLCLMALMVVNLLPTRRPQPRLDPALPERGSGRATMPDAASNPDPAAQGVEAASAALEDSLETVLAGVGDLALRMGRALEVIRRQFKARRGLLLVGDAGVQGLELTLTAGFAAEPPDRLLLVTGSGLIRRCLGATQAIVANSLTGADVDQVERRYSVDCLLCVPLETRRDSWANLILMDKQGGFSPADLEMARVAARRLSLGIGAQTART